MLTQGLRARELAATPPPLPSLGPTTSAAARARNQLTAVPTKLAALPPPKPSPMPAGDGEEERERTERDREGAKLT